MGYAGKLLRIDLAKERIGEEPLDRRIAERFIGGRGYAAKLLFDELQPKVDPLSPGNKLVFMTGPLTGLTPASARCAISSKSPLTGTISDSNIGGRCGVELKRAGYDGMIVEGKSRKPVYISVEDSEAEVKDASDLWGKSTSATVKVLQKAEGGASVLCVGPAGENLVKLASMLDDSYRATGRGGLGAVMGSKNLKAVVVSGSGRIRPANEAAFGVHFKMLEEMFAKHSGKNSACSTCPMPCGRAVRTGKSKARSRNENPRALWPKCGINNAEDIAALNTLCDELGLDLVSMGNALCYAMECSARGVIEEKVAFGDAKKALELIESTAYRRGLGSILSKGVDGMLKRMGGGKVLAMSSKGLENSHSILAIMDSLGLCKFAAPATFSTSDSISILVELLASATGFHFDEAELRLAGGRICELEQRFNAREIKSSADYVEYGYFFRVCSYVLPFGSLHLMNSPSIASGCLFLMNAWPGFSPFL